LRSPERGQKKEFSESLSGDFEVDSRFADGVLIVLFTRALKTSPIKAKAARKSRLSEGSKLS
jgi:hypothetical protein